MLTQDAINDAAVAEEDIELTGKSGEHYTGKIYTANAAASGPSERCIAVLTNSVYTDAGWTHNVNSIYNIESVKDELEHFQGRDDISYLILLPYNQNENGVVDKVDDLIRNYIHR